ncbi:unnamed protein product [Arctia plantaginis]|uniref:Uncharacterized protein n=1 Tax=Arctia plantaginis TaxID=874455 RepID=A0A8S0Z9R6_ARCPL|nr:unnamed protein product [Arctia plantaginis]
MTLDPRKYLIIDLINKSTPIDVWLQGTIEQTVGTDILIISDTTGRAKVMKCDTAHGIIDKSSLKKGTYCCIIGVTVKTKGVPEIHVSKFIDLTSQPQMKLAWEAEVKEANLFLEGKLIPTI